MSLDCHLQIQLTFYRRSKLICNSTEDSLAREKSGSRISLRRVGSRRPRGSAHGSYCLIHGWKRQLPYSELERPLGHNNRASVQGFFKASPNKAVEQPALERFSVERRRLTLHLFTDIAPRGSLHRYKSSDFQFTFPLRSRKMISELSNRLLEARGFPGFQSGGVAA